jgi:hypothetical protein
MTGRLQFRADGLFTIVQFTDTHWQNGGPADVQTAALMATVLDAERPDLVVLTGDVVEGEFSRDPAAAWRACVTPIVERRLPWAAVFGNHDDEGGVSRAELMAAQQAIPYCLSEPGPAHLSGVGNYVLPVDAATGDRPAAYLYFVDSNSYAETAIGGYGWIRRDQIAWYVETASRLRAANDGVTLPALAFFHIPVPEYETVWATQTCQGVKFEPVCSPRINSGFFAAMHEMGDVMGAFVGHDHVNDYVGELHGIRLCYGRATGFGGYGREGFPRGARIIRLQAGSPGFETWLRLEGGDAPAQPEHLPGT